MPRLRQITHSLLDDALGKNGGLGHVDVVRSSPATSMRTYLRSAKTWSDTLILALVTGSISSEYIKCESAAYNIKGIRNVNLDDHRTPGSVTSEVSRVHKNPTEV